MTRPNHIVDDGAGWRKFAFHRQAEPEHEDNAGRMAFPGSHALRGNPLPAALCVARRSALRFFSVFSHFPSEMNSTTATNYLDAASEAARRGAAVLEKWRQSALDLQVHEKGPADLVTNADLESQQTIRDYLTKQFPDHHFLGEEDQSATARPAADAPPTWIVDPLDGTTNYVHDCPLYCVSIGLQVAGELVAGVILEPRRQELFTAAKGHGARLNGKALRVSRTAALDQALLSTGFPPDLRGHEVTLDWFRHFSLRSRSVRRTGSTALNLAYIAAGRFDGYWGLGNHVWDVAAGVVLIREAGGMLTNIDGTEYDPFRPDALASNGALHAVLLSSFREGP